MLPTLLAGKLRATAETLRDLFYPPHCGGCGRALETDTILCGTCSDGAQKISGSRCHTCSQPFAGIPDFFECPNCRDRPFHFDCAISSYKSRGVVRELIHRFKYSRELSLGPQLGTWLAEGLADDRLLEPSPDALVPVPLHPSREREREFNQAAWLASDLSRRSGLPVRDCLRRIRPTGTQTQFDRRQRMRNLRDAFALRQNAGVTGSHLLLVDDVFTTGSTLDECARVLSLGGAASIRAITVARG